MSTAPPRGLATSTIEKLPSETRYYQPGAARAISVPKTRQAPSLTDQADGPVGFRPIMPRSWPRSLPTRGTSCSIAGWQ